MALMLMLIVGMLAGTAPQLGTQPQTPSMSSSVAPSRQPSTHPGAITPEAAIRAVLLKQVADWNRGDVRAFMQGYWNSPRTEFVSSGGILRGWQPVFERYRKKYPDGAAMGHLTFSSLEVTQLGPQAALVVGQWHLERKSGNAGGAFTLVFRKFPEGWRIINDHTSQSP